MNLLPRTVPSACITVQTASVLIPKSTLQIIWSFTDVFVRTASSVYEKRRKYFRCLLSSVGAEAFHASFYAGTPYLYGSTVHKTTSSHGHRTVSGMRHPSPRPLPQITVFPVLGVYPSLFFFLLSLNIGKNLIPAPVADRHRAVGWVPQMPAPQLLL